MRYFVQLSYSGTNYHGWQFQPNAITVQEVLEKAFSTLLQQKISITGAGRTDTGVHASYFIAHFNVDTPIGDLVKLQFRLNSFLPKDIAIQRIFEVPDDFHARFSALSRTYEYRVSVVKDPFLNNYSHRLHGSFDFEAMNRVAKSLFDYTDFTSFSKLHTDTFTNNCDIMQAEWTYKDNQHIFTIKADRFLRNMVRAITGTLFEVGKGKISEKDFCNIIEAKCRQKAGVSVPAQALFLTGIEYPLF